MHIKVKLKYKIICKAGKFQNTTHVIVSSSIFASSIIG